jgi:hypothetical protein
MTTEQVKDFFEAVVAGGPADLLDLDRAVADGRRRRRVRTATTLGSAAAVVLLAGALLFSALPRTASEPLGGATTPVPGPSQTTGTVAPIAGTAADWLAALERSMPYVDRTKPVSVTTNGPADLSKSSSVTAVFSYSSGGHTVSLTVTAFGQGTQAFPGTSNLDSALAGCGQGGVTCDPVQQTVAGPVLVRRAPTRGIVDAMSFRASGVVVVARISDGSTASASPGTQDGGSGPAISVDDLVNIATLSPEPVLADTTPTVTPPGTPAPATSFAVLPASPVVTVTSGQKVDLGSGSYLTVTKAEKCMVVADPPNPPTPNCKSLTDGNQAPKSISMQSGSGSSGSPEVITGIYTGADAATVIVTVEGKPETATIVKLGSHPTSLVYYVTWPTAVPPGAGGSGMLSVEAFDTNGHPLAKL